MTLKRRAGAAWTTVAATKRRSGSTWVALTFMRRRVGSAWVDVLFIPLTATASPTAVSGHVDSVTIGNKNVTSNATTVTPANGSGGTKTYAWTLLSGTAMTVNSPTSATTTFTKSIAPSDPPIPVTATYRCTVSDGTFTATADVSVSLECEYVPT